MGGWQLAAGSRAGEWQMADGPGQGQGAAAKHQTPNTKKPPKKKPVTPVVGGSWVGQGFCFCDMLLVVCGVFELPTPLTEKRETPQNAIKKSIKNRFWC
jgi:hypothetical protein